MSRTAIVELPTTCMPETFIMPWDASVQALELRRRRDDDDFDDDEEAFSFDDDDEDDEDDEDL